MFRTKCLILFFSVFLFVDEDGSGAIDREELRRCFHKAEVNFTDEEINDLFELCDINDDMVINFNEFIVLLCLVYLLKRDPTVPQSVSYICFTTC